MTFPFKPVSGESGVTVAIHLLRSITVLTFTSVMQQYLHIELTCFFVFFFLFLSGETLLKDKKYIQD